MWTRAVAVILLSTGCSGPDVEGQAETADSPDVQVTSPSPLVGHEWPPLPSGYAQHGGMTLGAEYGLVHVSSAEGQSLLLSSFRLRDEAGRAHWRVEAVATLPELEAGEAVAWVDCSLQDEPDASIAAIGRWTDGGPHIADLTNIRYAVRPEPDRKSFDVLPPDQVECWYDEDRS